MCACTRLRVFVRIRALSLSSTPLLPSNPPRAVPLSSPTHPRRTVFFFFFTGRKSIPTNRISHSPYPPGLARGNRTLPPSAGSDRDTGISDSCRCPVSSEPEQGIRQPAPLPPCKAFSPGSPMFAARIRPQLEAYRVHLALYGLRGVAGALRELAKYASRVRRVSSRRNRPVGGWVAGG